MYVLRAALLLVFATLAPGRPAIAAGTTSAELRCLALNVYWEARSGPSMDRLAVAYVTLNRVASPDFPGTICAVVHQGGEARDRCQFSWWCDGKPDRPANPEAWRAALAIARLALSGRRPDPTGGALYFHDDNVLPGWVYDKQRTARIGPHVFYR